MNTAAYAWELQRVVIGYGGPPVLSIDELKIEAGSVTAIVGRNGAGKSTLLRMLALQTLPSGGDVRFGGAPVTAKALVALRRRVGLLPQSPLPVARHSLCQRGNGPAPAWHGVQCAQR